MRDCAHIRHQTVRSCAKHCPQHREEHQPACSGTEGVRQGVGIQNPRSEPSNNSHQSCGGRAVCRERSRVRARPEEQGPEQQWAAPGGHKARTPDTRAEAGRREHPHGPRPPPQPHRPHPVHAAGPARPSLSCSRAWALQTPAEGPRALG